MWISNAGKVVKMKEIKLYQCAYCGTQYSIKDHCMECEDFHNTKLKITHKRYVGYKKCNDRFPVEIIVEDSSGMVAKYRRA